MKIRIGSDVRLEVDLPIVDGQQLLNATIYSLDAYFINTTLKEEILKRYKNKHRFIGRFPIEPFTDEFEPTAYNINSAGFPRYKAIVYNQYNGFGYNPNWKECSPIREVNVVEYRADVIRTTNVNTVALIFPAAAQKHPGVYELVIIAKIHDSGYKNNERIVTINKKNVFELVTDSEEEGVQNPITISINSDQSVTPKQDVYVYSGSYQNGTIILNRNDNEVVDIDVTPITQWYEGG